MTQKKFSNPFNPSADELAKTDAGNVLEARRGSYTPMAGGYADETTLLLLSQHHGEIRAQREAAARKARRAKSKPSGKR